ncbi:TonB-dependent heme receptor [Vibrio scophthalmi]|uniref:TonB-dependent receptor domain-containing protein n=1 Tax=Vibrio scophthalmi TaxID=45658 RepID=UPI00080934DA|nr:TonB-dependent receptor [Vibrio scophthalmi]ANS87396.1 TonB-dependent heme receptor [Vibrio scophthalmi]
MDTVFKLSPVAIALIAFSTSAQETEIIEVTGQQLIGVDTIITAEELSQRQASDLNDVFRNDPEVTVGGSSGISQKIYVRGLEDTMLNVTIDGAQQTSNLFHHQGRLSIEPELLKQVDISAGAGRATNGPGALGGAIQFKTKDAHDLLHNGDKFGAQVKTGYYTNNKGQKYSASVYGEVIEGLGLLATYGYVDGDNIKDGNGDEQDYTATEQHVGLIKLSGQINPNHYLSLAYDFRDDDGTRLTKPHFQPSFKNTPLEQEADRKTATLNYRYTQGNYIAIDATAYNTRSRIAHLDNPRWGTSDGTIETFGGKLFNTATVQQHTVIIGADYRDDESEFETNWDGNRFDHEKGKVYGLFIQDDWQISDSVLLSAGARYDWYKLTDNIDQQFESSGFSPNVAIDYEVASGVVLFANYAEAFRGQTAKELFIIDWYENDPNRGPERAKNFEFGTRVMKENFFAGITVFDSRIKDVVDKDTTSGHFTNVGELTTRGVTAYLGTHLGDFSTQLNYNQSKPELNGVPLSDGDSTLGTSIGDTWVLDLNYTVSQALQFGWTSTFVERLSDVADESTYPEKPGYGVHDLYAQWQPITNEELILTFSVKNVFDKQYFDHGSYMGIIGSEVAQGYASAGRDLRFNLSYAF